MVYKAGDKVKAIFQSACPRNNVRLESTFLTVERQDDEDAEQWEVVSNCISTANTPCPCPCPCHAALIKSEVLMYTSLEDAQPLLAEGYFRGTEPPLASLR